MERKKMRSQWAFRQKGVTLLELLVTLVIAGLIIAGIYRVFIAQSKAYTVQDQIVEVQQNVRGAMEILLRDLRMAGFNYDNPASTVYISNPIAYPVQASSTTLSYEYYDKTTSEFKKHTVLYSRDAATSRLYRQLTVNDTAGPSEILLENVDALTFTHGVDQNEDGAMDDRNGNGMIDDNDWVPSANVGALKVVAVRVALTGRPEKLSAEDDRFNTVSPRTLVSAVTLRNMSLIK